MIFGKDNYDNVESDVNSKFDFKGFNNIDEDDYDLLEDELLDHQMETEEPELWEDLNSNEPDPRD